jgi:hypothetical protein
MEFLGELGRAARVGALQQNRRLYYRHERCQLRQRWNRVQALTNARWCSLKRAILGVIVLCSLAACASVDKDWKPLVRDDSEYVTGSNLPRRKTSLPSEATTLSDQAVEEMQRIRPALPAPGASR